MDKPMTLRLPEPQAEALSTVAEVLGLPVVEVVRLAVADYIDRCRREPSFQERLRESAARVNRAMDSLRWPETGTGS